MPKISIIIPSYNSNLLLLSQALKSVKDQTMTDYEAIVVDDGSMDGRAIGAALDATRLKARVLVKENGGVASAREYGLRRSNGKYVMFLDDDDMYHPTICERLSSALDRTSADFSSCAGVEGIEPDWGKHADRGAVVEKTPEKLINMSMSIFNRCFRRDLIERHGIKFPVGVRMCDDFVFLMLYANFSSTFFETTDRLYFYRVNRASQRSTMGNDLKKFLPDIDKAIAFMEDFFTEAMARRGGTDRVRIDDDVRKYIAGHFLNGGARFG